MTYSLALAIWANIINLMNNIWKKLRMTELLAPYSDALFLVAVLMIVVIVQSFVAAFFRNAVEKHEAGESLEANHASTTYRMVRSFENSAENIILSLLWR